MNQYCETLPAAKGPRPPRPGAPGVGAALPADVARAIAQGQNPTAEVRALGARSKLAAPHPRRPTRAALRVNRSSTAGLPLWLILVLAALALALIAAAVVRSRRGPPPPVSGEGAA